MIKNNDAEVTVRDVVPYTGSQSILPYNSIKHRIQRRMEKEINSAKKQARIVRAKKIYLTTMELEDTPRIKGEWDQLPTVDIATMNRFLWIDFNYIIGSADVNEREQVRFDILQKNLPYLDDNRYYIYHDPNTNVFSIDEDVESEDIDNFQILLINAKLKVRDLSSKERAELIKTRKLKLKELRSTFGAIELASALSNNMSREELSTLEDTVITHLTDLNRDADENYYTFNEDTEEFEIRIDDQDNQLITQVVTTIIKLDSKIENPRTAPSDRRRMYGIRNKFVAHLRKLGANELADSL